MMIFTLALTILTHLFTPGAITTSEHLMPCEDAAPDSVCVMFDDVDNLPAHWIITDTDNTFIVNTGLCQDTPAPCLLADTDGWKLITIVS